MEQSSSTQFSDVQAYLDRKKRENGNERLRLAKALQWYFFYIALLIGGIYLIHDFPSLLNIFGSNESYEMVIAFYILMYGVVMISYMTTPWPYPLLPDLAANVRTMNWSTQLCWIERIMVIIYYAFFLISFLQPYLKGNWIGAVILAASQLPHVISALIGFPKKKALQALGIFFRIIGLVCSFAIMLMLFINFNPKQTMGIASVIGGLPFLLLIGMHFNGRVDRRNAFFIFGRVSRSKVIIAISVFCFVVWTGFLGFMIYIYSNPALFPAKYHWVPLDAPFSSLADFCATCVVACMAVLSIPCLYHSLLNLELTYPAPSPKATEMAESNGKGVKKEDTHHLITSIQIDGAAPPDFMNQIALVIACHKSKDNIINTLRAAHYGAKFPLENIYIAHNAGTPEPIDETGKVVWENDEFRDVHYIYIPVGNKSIAINYILENYVKGRLPLMVMIDDDVILPSDVDLKGGYEQIMNTDDVKAVAFTIRGIETANFWQKFQHVEYMQAGLLKMFQGQFGTVLTCHGAIAMWDVDSCCEVFNKHNTEFHGEDLQMGLILRRMNKGYKIQANAIGPVPTASPKSLLYETDANEKSLFSQRVFSWDMAAHHFFLDFIWLTFMNWESSSLILKPFCVIELWTMMQDWLRFLFLTQIFLADPINAGALIGALIVLQMIIVLMFDKMVLAHRPELQSPLHIVLLYPIYNFVTVMFRFVGLLYNALSYTPWNPPRIIIADRKRMGLIPPKVVEPRGTNVEREMYWKSVWKAESYRGVAESAVSAAHIIVGMAPSPVQSPVQPSLSLIPKTPEIRSVGSSVSRLGKSSEVKNAKPSVPSPLARSSDASKSFPNLKLSDMLPNSLLRNSSTDLKNSKGLANSAELKREFSSKKMPELVSTKLTKKKLEVTIKDSPELLSIASSSKTPTTPSSPPPFFSFPSSASSSASSKDPVPDPLTLDGDEEWGEQLSRKFPSVSDFQDESFLTRNSNFYMGGDRMSMSITSFSDMTNDDVSISESRAPSPSPMHDSFLVEAKQISDDDWLIEQGLSWLSMPQPSASVESIKMPIGKGENDVAHLKGGAGATKAVLMRENSFSMPHAIAW